MNRPRFAEERSNELAKMIAEKEETITKLRSQQASVKPIQDFPAAEPSSELYIISVSISVEICTDTNSILQTIPIWHPLKYACLQVDQVVFEYLICLYINQHCCTCLIIFESQLVFDGLK